MCDEPLLLLHCTLGQPPAAVPCSGPFQYRYVTAPGRPCFAESMSFAFALVRTSFHMGTCCCCFGPCQQHAVTVTFAAWSVCRAAVILLQYSSPWSIAAAARTVAIHRCAWLPELAPFVPDALLATTEGFPRERVPFRPFGNPCWQPCIPAEAKPRSSVTLTANSSPSTLSCHPDRCWAALASRRRSSQLCRTSPPSRRGRIVPCALLALQQGRKHK